MKTNNPEAFIASNRNRLKIYNGKEVYLKDNAEFQIEMFNPTTSTVAAKIYLNGKAISERRIVVKPGERVYVERFLDVQKKFRFETYEIEDSKAAKAAIADNGSVKVEFYTEYIPYTWFGGGTVTTTPWFNPPTTPTVPYYPYTTPYYTTTENTNNMFFCSTDSLDSITFKTSAVNCSATLTGSLGINPQPQSVETGRVEIGSDSNQTFQNYTGQFNMYPSTTVEYKILPESGRPIDAKQIRIYCTGCGTRIRKATHKFCSNCGTKVE